MYRTVKYNLVVRKKKKKILPPTVAVAASESLKVLVVISSVVTVTPASSLLYVSSVTLSSVDAIEETTLALATASLLLYEVEPAIASSESETCCGVILSLSVFSSLEKLLLVPEESSLGQLLLDSSVSILKLLEVNLALGSGIWE